MVSIDIINVVILIGSLLVLLGVFSSLVATRFGVPLLLVFLAVGMLAGENGPGGLIFDDYRATYLVGSLALSVILFDGGLRTKLSAFQGALLPSLVLATIGVLITAAITAAAVYWLIDGMKPIEALLLGSIVGSTDAAAVFFLLRSGGLRLQTRIGSTLEIESGTNDPIAVFLAIVLTEFLLAGSSVPSIELLSRLGQQALIGAVAGVAGGFALVALLNRVQMATGLHPVFVIAGAVLIYAATSLLDGSGLLAAYLAGLVMANRPVRAYPSIVGFHDAATWLCQIVMFVLLGLLVTPATLFDYALPGVAVALTLIFIARPAAVWLCLLPFGFSRRETLFASWVGLRGAVSIFLAAIPMLSGLDYAEAFFNIAFFVVLVSLLVQGSTIAWVARRLGVALRRVAPSVRRVEVDIPGQVDQEMVGYPVSADSLILGLSHLPNWARVVLVVRENEILDAAKAGAPQPGDYVYFLTPPDRIPRLDQLLSESHDLARRMSSQFGELPINGDATMGGLCDLYELEVSEGERELTVADYFRSHLKNPPQPGVRLPMGNSTLIARLVEDGEVVRAGLLHVELVDSFVAGVLAHKPEFPSKDAFGRMGRRLQDGFARLPRPRRKAADPAPAPAPVDGGC